MDSGWIFLIGSDLMMYWMHRAFHRPAMWKYHAVHHSSEELDWISAARFHPVNIFLGSVAADVVLLLAGISPNVLVFLGPFTIAHSAFVHANLNWTLGPFRYVLASPVFHRWHHTAADRGGDKNFASTFPIIDVLFGTYYMPENEMPDAYGVADAAFPPTFGCADDLSIPAMTDGAMQAEPIHRICGSFTIFAVNLMSPAHSAAACWADPRRERAGVFDGAYACVPGFAFVLRRSGVERRGPCPGRGSRRRHHRNPRPGQDHEAARPRRHPRDRQSADRRRCRCRPAASRSSPARVTATTNIVALDRTGDVLMDAIDRGAGTARQRGRRLSRRRAGDL